MLIVPPCPRRYKLPIEQEALERKKAANKARAAQGLADATRDKVRRYCLGLWVGRAVWRLQAVNARVTAAGDCAWRLPCDCLALPAAA